ncbi:hypothetical protein GYH30_033728 [Glycine max]|uniref:Brix domain-containing protein n=1 Tax=Glycine max TaxID=3847 RepID=A0A0R0H542_SOYBN|nr:hypothetical protein GYH30_033728 [Glycine max]
MEIPSNIKQPWNSEYSVPRTHIDDEYAYAAEKDPKILLTTSRDPSAPLQQFVKELSFVFPNVQRVNPDGQMCQVKIIFFKGPNCIFCNSVCEFGLVFLLLDI